MNSNPSPPEPRGALPWLARKLGSRQLTAGRSLAIIIGATAAVTIAGGIAIRLLDPKDYDSIGEGMWWAVQSVTTVGYGDIVPQAAGGRLIATVVMLTGIAFISLVTASVTATLVEQNRRRQQGSEETVEAKLDQIGARLEAIENRLEGGGHRDSSSA